jgi:hypothetical protein
MRGRPAGDRSLHRQIQLSIIGIKPGIRPFQRPQEFAAQRWLALLRQPARREPGER